MSNYCSGKIEWQAKQILLNYPIIKELPASISGVYHVGETALEHIERTASIMRHLCDEFKQYLTAEDKDMLIACAYLHDMGSYVISKKGKPSKKQSMGGWIYYEKTGFSRLEPLHRIHPIISASMINAYQIDRKEDIKKVIASHMSHWYPHAPQPKCLWEYLICIADYLASRKNVFDNRTSNWFDELPKRERIDERNK
ncbi:MAG: HD domain-containing protein [Promethearchaeota archaeon]